LLILAATLASCAPTSAPELQPRQARGRVGEATDEPDETPRSAPPKIALTAQAVALANAGCLQCHTDE